MRYVEVTELIQIMDCGYDEETDEDEAIILTLKKKDGNNMNIKIPYAFVEQAWQFCEESLKEQGRMIPEL